MRTKKEIAENQIRIQEAMQSAGFNIVTCGNCGSILLHETGDETIECFCQREMDLSDCPDYWYEGCQDNEEFKGTEKQIENFVLNNELLTLNADKVQITETKVYVMPILLDYDYEALKSCSDEEFIVLAKEEGRVFDLKEFNEAFNNDAVNPHLDIIRIINVNI